MMIEIFKTEIKQQQIADKVSEALRKEFIGAMINFDLDDRDRILRVEAKRIDSKEVIAVLASFGISCKVIPDKRCPARENSSNEMKDRWDNSFRSHQAVWGFEPAQSAVLANELFTANGIKNVLIPGFGYGRNAQLFTHNGINVTGIEISPTAISIAKQHYKGTVEILQGSVTEMPLNSICYEGIFCHGLLYLLNTVQRKQMLEDCYNQLQPGGYMLFSLISKKASNYGNGKQIAQDTFENAQGMQIFFYDSDSIEKEFEPYCLQDILEIKEYTSASKITFFDFFVAICRKPV